MIATIAKFFFFSAVVAIIWKPSFNDWSRGKQLILFPDTKSRETKLVLVRY